MATYYVDATLGLDTNNGTSTATPYKTLSKASLNCKTAGDICCLKRGEVWYEGLEIYYGGVEGTPIIWTSYGAGNLPIVKGSDLATSWTQDGSNWYTSYNMIVAWGGTINAYGVWEDGAPLFSVAALSNIRPGTFFYDSGTSRLYIRTYENDDPHNHVMEYSRHYYPSAAAIHIADSSGGIATDYLVISNIRAEKGQLSGVYVGAGAHVKNSITLQNMVITENFGGISYSGTFAQTINVNNSVVWGNPYNAVSSYNGGTNAATVNIKNSVVGGTLFFNTFEPATGGTINVDYSVVSGHLQGRYFLTNVNAGTLNITNTSYRNPRFTSAGGLGVAAFNSDDSEGTGYHLGVANIFNSRGLKYTWHIASMLDSGQWSEVNAVIAANQIIGLHTRNHNQMSSAPGGTDIVNAIAINYAGACTTATATYDNAAHTLTTYIDGVEHLVIDVTSTNLGGYDVSILGDATHGLIGYLSHQTNYSAAYPSTASSSIFRTGGAIYVSSRVLADQANVNIKSPGCSATGGCIALDATRYSNSEIFTAGQRDGEYADWDAQTGAIVGYTTTDFSYPFEEWSVAEIARLYARGIRSAYAGDTVNSMTVASHALLNQLYALNLPIAAPYASALHMTMDTSQNGIDEAENAAAVLSTYPVVFNLFSHSPSEVSIAALTSFVDNLISQGVAIKPLSEIVSSSEAAGAIWDVNSYHLTRKIVPTDDYRVTVDSPAIYGGTDVGLALDADGLPIRDSAHPNIGAYESWPKIF